MKLNLLDLTIDTLPDLVRVCRELPEDEQDLWYRMSGVKYVADNIAMTMFRCPGFHWIAHDGERPVAAGGFVKQREGVFRTWLCATELAWDPHGRDLTRILRKGIKEIITRGIAHRVETVTLLEKKRAWDWYPAIGLQHEATLHGYGINGEDAVVYVALRDVEKV